MLSYTYVLVLLFCGFTVNLAAQDTYLHHFYGNESSFNPAMTGQAGALRFGVSYRSQWGASTAPAYVARKVVLEESLPCLFFDYGLFARSDEEGAGNLTTTEFGGSAAATIPLVTAGARQPLNLDLRVGLGFVYGQRRVDFAALTFLDQIDPFFGLTDADGNANPTGFVAPTGAGDSPNYTTGSVGISFKGGLNPRRGRAIGFDVGAALHNPSFFTGRDGRQTASLLGLDNTLGQRLVITGRADWVAVRGKGYSWSFKPSAVYQQQEGLSYLEVGTGVSWNRFVTLGGYYHLARPSSVGRNVGWTSARLEVGGRLPNTQTRFDVGLSYALQHGFLKNYVRPPLEVSAVFSFGRSTTCGLLGFGDKSWMSKTNKTGCPAYLRGLRKIYDNIWYRDVVL